MVLRIIRENIFYVSENSVWCQKYHLSILLFLLFMDASMVMETLLLWFLTHPVITESDRCHLKNSVNYMIHFTVRAIKGRHCKFLP